MRIVRLRQQSQLWADILLEDGTHLRCPLSVVAELGLRKGDELSAASLEELRRRSRLWHIRHEALRFLARRAHTREELRRKLARKFPEDGTVIEEVLGQLSQEGYLDDAAFAEAFARARLERRAASSLRLFAELRRRGVAPEIAHRVLRHLLPEDAVLEQARRAAQEKLRRLHSHDPHRRWRALAGYLSRQGFPAAAIRQILQECFPELPGEPDES
ncbi:Regulatory protein RecX [bacterium HR21]|nr:Regulatory protein RecX [bacterium HR21]